MKTPRFKRTEDNKRLVGVPQYGKEALGKTIGVRFPKDLDDELRKKEDRQQYIREAVRNQLERDRASENNN